MIMPRGIYERKKKWELTKSVWTEEMIKAFHKHMVKYPHNLQEGFRTFEHNGWQNHKSASQAYYYNARVKKYFKDNKILEIYNIHTGNVYANRKNAVNMLGVRKGFTPYVQPVKGAIEVVYLNNKLKKTKVIIKGKDLTFSFEQIDD